MDEVLLAFFVSIFDFFEEKIGGGYAMVMTVSLVILFAAICISILALFL